MAVRYISVSVLIIIAVISDTRAYKISNRLNLVFIILGLALNTYESGLMGAAAAILSAMSPALLLLPLFALRMLGAGDIKLFASIGAIMGLKFTFEIVLYSILCGGIIALVLILLRKNAIQRFKYFAEYLKSCFLTLSFLPYTDFSNKSDRANFRFSYAIACGIIVKFIKGTSLFVQ